MIALTHDVRESFYRAPKGAVPCGTNLRFRVVVEDDDSVASVRLFYVYGLSPFKESFSLMQRESMQNSRAVYGTSITMDHEPGLFFYWFELQLNDGRYRWGFPDEDTCGLTIRTSVVSPAFKTDGTEYIPGFQVTVYREDFKTPDWMKGAVIYQIFPDRFSRGKCFDGKKATALMRAPERIWHEDWDEEVDFLGKAPVGYEACDFFGGSLNGIREYLASLSAMGVNVLYLNPVFKAKSNHRYDTGDYLVVDPLLGTNEELIALFEEARALGIRVILDGVFSHTGADSRYFNRFGRYDSVGAWQAVCEGQDSPYTSWYRFSHETTKDGAPRYECWWDFPELPNVHEDDLSYREFILGEEGVLAFWLNRGCSGFRLDVSDELPDSFLRLLRKRVKKTQDDAFIIGEIWEEPTAKISYGAYRDFLFGNTHDAVMGYVFQKAVIRFLTGDMDANALKLAFDKLCDVTPFPALYTQMNLLGSHDTPRIITALAGEAMPKTRKEQSALALSDKQREQGEALVVLASVFQLAFPGATALYYGDEYGMEGYDDPFNRRTFPKEEDRPLLQMTENMTQLMQLKQRTPVLKTGFFEVLEAAGDRFVCRRYLKDHKDVFGKKQEGPEEAVITILRGPACQADIIMDNTMMLSF